MTLKIYGIVFYFALHIMLCKLCNVNYKIKNISNFMNFFVCGPIAKETVGVLLNSAGSAARV